MYLHVGLRAIVLSILLPVCMMIAIGAHADETITGTVTDEKSEPLIGATVMVAGSNTGAATDIDGKFTLQAKQGATLRVSYVGYTSTSVKVNARDLKIVLKEDNALLDEVVVVGYGSMKRKDLTGSISTVNAKDLNV